MAADGVDGSEADPAAAALIKLLAQRRETLATAESLTGGLLGEKLTTVPGASQVYRGGVISYATDLKATLAGVGEPTLIEHGAVSPVTAQEMARGVAMRCGARWGLATTGVAGPEPQDGHPVGEVYVGLADCVTGWWFASRLNLTGSRLQIRHATATQALELLRRYLLSLPG